MHRRDLNPLLCVPTMALLLSLGACSHFHHRGSNKEESPKLDISSAAFNDGEEIPLRNTCDGKNISPPLKWSGIPESTRSLVLICDDPDAPAGTWVHWVLYDLPPTVSELAEAVSQSGTPAQAGTQGVNDFKGLGYGGPCPPPGMPHRYFFKLYALDEKLNLKPGATKNEVVNAMKGHTLAEGQLMGSYKKIFHA